MRSEISVNVPSASTPLTPADPTTINTHSPPPQPLISFFRMIQILSCIASITPCSIGTGGAALYM